MFTVLSFQSKFSQRCHLTCNLHFYSPPVANTPPILTNTCNNRTTDRHCSSIPLAPLDITGPTGHYSSHWTLQAPLDTTEPIGYYGSHWKLQVTLDTTVDTKYYRPHWTLQNPLDTMGHTGNYKSHWTQQAPLNTSGPTGNNKPHWILQFTLNTTSPTGHYRSHWILRTPLHTTDPTGHYRPHWAPQPLLRPRPQTTCPTRTHNPQHILLCTASLSLCRTTNCEPRLLFALPRQPTVGLQHRDRPTVDWQRRWEGEMLQL